MIGNLKTLLNNIKISHVILIWLILNILSASFTVLYNDEAYYTLFSTRLAWGYFDHPPMVALFIRLGTLLGHNEFSVRMMSVIAVAVALYLIYKLSEVQNPLLFLALIMSVFAVNLLGFMALPDAPLLLFTALFFIAYRRFLQRDDILNLLILSAAMSAMLYSKYHGILVILITVISNLRLLRSFRFLVSCGIGILLFLPHLMWQYNNDFVSFSYHIVERSAPVFKLSLTLEYLIGQVLFYGPVTVFFLYLSLIRYKPGDKFDRALIWNIWGILGFFLASSLRGRVEPNWTLPAIVPMLIIFMRFADGKTELLRRFYQFALPVTLLILLFRIQMIYPLINVSVSRIDDIRNQKDFVKEVVKKSQGLPIVTGSYQKASIISFYSGAFSPAINLNGRRNQFSLWNSCDSLRFHKVAYINNYLDEGVKIENPSFNDFRVTVIDSLPVMDDISILIEPIGNKMNSNQEFSVGVVLSGAKPYSRYRDMGKFNTRLYAQLYAKDRLIKEEVCEFPVGIILNYYNGEYKFRFTLPPEKGDYTLLFTLRTSELGSWSSGKSVHIKAG